MNDSKRIDPKDMKTAFEILDETEGDSSGQKARAIAFAIGEARRLGAATGRDEIDYKTITVAWAYKSESGNLEYENASEYSLFEGNDSCDCNKLNRLDHILTPEKYPELYHIKGNTYPDGSGPVSETGPRCGHQITFRVAAESV